MTQRFDSIDLTKVPMPDAIVDLDPEAELQLLISRCREVFPEWETYNLESSPIIKILEVVAYRNTEIAARHNDAVKACSATTATGADLVNRAADRKVVPLEGESDDQLRRRVLLAPENLTTAGTEGAYIFQAYSASPKVSDVAIDAPEFENYQPEDAAMQELLAQLPSDVICLQVVRSAGFDVPRPGHVAVIILSADDDGQASSDLINTVSLALDDVRPIGDVVEVRQGVKVDYEVRADLFIRPGPEPAIVLERAIEAVTAFVARQRRLGEYVTRDGLHAALRQEGVIEVDLLTPENSIKPGPDAYPYCVNIDVRAA